MQSPLLPPSFRLSCMEIIVLDFSYRQLRQQPLVAGHREQLLGCLRQLDPEVGHAHHGAIAIRHRTTLLPHERVHLPEKTTAEPPGAVARRSWVLRGVNYAGVAEEARTRGFVPPAFTGFAFGAAGAASYKSDIPRGPGGVKDPRRGLLRTHPVP